MKTIGLRATPTEVWFSVIEEVDHKITISVSSKVNVPVSLIFPEKLNYIRKTFKDIIWEFKVTGASIRITESNAQGTSSERISIEAILQELLSSSSVEKYFVGQISNISAKAGFPREDFKKYISGELAFNRVESWSTYNNYQKESILAAIAAINL